MKSIAVVNTVLPTVESSIDYSSGKSLQDYDIVLFDPGFPYAERIDFSGGGSCLSIEGGQRIRSALNHWRAELLGALNKGKTVFFLLNEQKLDSAAVSSTTAKSVRNYSTTSIQNYEALPLKLGVKNTRGQKIQVTDGSYRGLYDALKEVAHYRVMVEPEVGKKIFATRDGAEVGAVVGLNGIPGRVVLLPYFDLNEFDEANEREWSKGALRISQAIVSQLIAIDGVLRKQSSQTPPPAWVERIERPKRILAIDESVKAIEGQIEALQKRMEGELASKLELSDFEHLLYETGNALESAIEKALTLLEYHVENLRIGDLEIDHVITGPNGVRMIGESEGKDTSAIDISKFRQLESNIQEDFQRDEVDVAAKGVIFGNGFRFAVPEERGEQFTQKCLANAKRLGTALVKTADLYNVIVYLLDNPNDQAFKAACRLAIEGTVGDVVNFPSPKLEPKGKAKKK